MINIYKQNVSSINIVQLFHIMVDDTYVTVLSLVRTGFHITSGNEDVRRKNINMTIIVSRFTQKFLNQMMSKYDILALEVVCARSAKMGLISALLVQ
jgi:acetolactate synthase regulatory subunit